MVMAGVLVSVVLFDASATHVPGEMQASALVEFDDVTCSSASVGFNFSGFRNSRMVLQPFGGDAMRSIHVPVAS